MKLFDNKVILAPMAGVTDKAFREVAVKFGVGLTFTEMVSAKGIYYNDKKTKSLLDIKDEKGRIGAQIFGHEAQIISIAARCAEECGATLLDINSGCPTPKVTKNNDGAALMKNPSLFAEVVSAAASSTKLPVSVKIRKGWSDDNINAVEIAKIAERCGASMITVHGRTAAAGYSGKADWSIIKKVVSSVNIPVVGNGDIFKPHHSKAMLKETGCAAVMLGRGVLGNPWLIRDTLLCLKERSLPPPGLHENRGCTVAYRIACKV